MAFLDGLFWPSGDEASRGLDRSSSRRRHGYRYDVSGLVRIDSEVELPELAFFLTESATPPDIRVRVRRFGGLPTRRVRVCTNGETLLYRERVGVFGVDVSLTLGETLEVEVAPLLALSRQLLYSHVVEALLRYALVAKGHVLVRAAALDANGEAALLSAGFDLSRPAVADLARMHGYGLISTAMAILDPAGSVRPFPTPPTARLVPAPDAENADGRPNGRRQLVVQTRIRWKSGRTIEEGSHALHAPILAPNATVRIASAPARYRARRHQAAAATVRGLYLLEQSGEPRVESIERGAAVETLLRNTDAGGGPVSAALGQNLEIGGITYAELRDRERGLLESALKNATTARLAAGRSEWPEAAASLIERHAGVREPIAIAVEPEPGTGLPIEPAPEYVGLVAQALAAEALGRLADAAAVEPGPDALAPQVSPN